MIVSHNYKNNQAKQWQTGQIIRNTCIYNNNRCYDNGSHSDDKVIIYWVVNILVTTLLVTIPTITTHK